ncbi:glycosyltransferase family A protein [Kaistia defluvii]|uniref:glycosyltransferase family A protein n=1 Tax=Kaistia defluvii TaxID=410841 RepID=UPI00225721D0|nr:glycosyltransferase family A protein [Kaistia defluvii]MCX5518803.1 glycosyltransferase family A protein [Kaistia defluvii]
MSSRYTVIIPAFNATRTLADAIASLRGQTVPPARVLLVDDGSTDGTGDHARELGIDVIRQDNRGPGAACNLALQTVDTPITAYLDADDLWLPKKAAWQLASLDEATDVDAVFGHLRIFFHGRPVDPAARTQEGWGRTTMMIRTDCARRIGPIYDPLEGGRGDMIDWIARGREMGLRFQMSPSVVALRRVIAGSMSYGRDERDVGYLEIARRALTRRRAALAASTGSGS